MEENKAIIRWNKDKLVSNDPQERVLVWSIYLTVDQIRPRELDCKFFTNLGFYGSRGETVFQASITGTFDPAI